jgi:hypothetical protein
VGLEEFGDVGGIEQSGLDEDAGAEPVVPEIGVDDVAVKREAEDFQFHNCARCEGHREERTNAGLGDVLKLPNPLAIVVQFGEPNGQVTGNAFIESAVHSLPNGIAGMSEIL